MNILSLNRDSIIKQTVQNMIEAQIVKPEEDKKFTAQLQQLNPKDLLTVLLESHNFREQAKEHISYYPIDAESFSSN